MRYKTSIIMPFLLMGCITLNAKNIVLKRNKKIGHYVTKSEMPIANYEDGKLTLSLGTYTYKAHITVTDENGQVVCEKDAVLSPQQTELSLPECSNSENYTLEINYGTTVVQGTIDHE